ncbi:DNA helicase-2/ATP-dependent DNA helicase PcrA [Stackebrandtia albiflava]|uniref:DNA 3'-5' helicase n=1 Tax=Stackebrandtia albiflava TaxID=406432 RepID=A0A562V508_9ACTN|nr:UvrD-helicase domain-containing protein [Stackebrandtia albiflava]TWJ12897.1 DNA helicase-2/ATP-dependent DNA helicase PcrA [Stackebrandtia albiflava]
MSGHRFSARRLAALLGDPHPPTAQQAAAIEAPLSPQLIVAGAGSGKTATMAARVVWLIANGHVRADQILGLTFTRKAAAELARRIRSRLARLAGVDGVTGPGGEPATGEPTVSTYHAYAASLVTEHGLRAGIETGATVLSSAQAWQVAYAVVRGYDGDMSATNLSVDEIAKRVLSLSDEISEHLSDADGVRGHTEQLLEELRARLGRSTKAVEDLVTGLRARLQLLPLVAEYRERKRAMPAQDFADQLAQAAHLAITVPQVGVIERERYPVVLLDEYQDTSHAQVELLKAVFGGGHPVTAVGDPCQSIYAWRGASAGTLARFRDDFRTRDGEPAARAELTVSWRNTAAVLGVANAISEPLRAGGLPVSVLEPGAAGDGEVTAALLSTVDDEAEWVADRIRRHWDETDPQSPPSTAVLVRKRDQIARLERALRDRDLPVEVVGLGGLLDAPEVREVYATLQVLAKPGSGPALVRLLTGPRWRIGPRDLTALYRRARELAPEQRGYEPTAEGLDEVTLAEALEDPGDPDSYSPAAWERFGELRAELALLRSRADQPVTDLIGEICRVSGLDVEIIVHRQDTARLDAFVEEAARYSGYAAAPSLAGFLSYLEAAEERERGLEVTGATVHTGAVQIMTVHAAKGLEWDCVAVPGLVDGGFPGRTRDANWLTATGRLPYPLRGDAMELPVFDLSEVTAPRDLTTAVKRFAADLREHHETEERRLAYVAFTRARHRLWACGHWWSPAAQSPRGPSTFLTELRAAGATVGEWLAAPTSQENPLLADHVQAVWPPTDPLGERQAAWLAAAEAVRRPVEPGSDAADSRWAEEVDLLLAERAESAADEAVLPRPDRLSVSQLVAWHTDAQRFASSLRRPVPEAPAPHTRRGTAFHAWVERRFGATALIDLAELPGAADPHAAPDESLRELQEAFEASEWAGRTPVALEVPFTTVLESVVVRGRMDAVFATPDGGYEVVDWKTGPPPRGRAARAAAMQLAAYRQAWAALRNVPVAKVTAAFHHVADDVTIRPADLPGLAELAEPLRTRDTGPLPRTRTATPAEEHTSPAAGGPTAGGADDRGVTAAP